jgi:hypothetical protein
MSLIGYSRILDMHQPILEQDMDGKTYASSLLRSLSPLIAYPYDPVSLSGVHEHHGSHSLS